MDAAARDVLRQAIAYEHLLFQHFEHAQAEADRWHQRWGLATRRGETELASQALERQQQAEQRARRYRLQYEEHAASLRLAKRGLTPVRPDRLEQLVREDHLERDLAELKARLKPSP